MDFEVPGNSGLALCMAARRVRPGLPCLLAVAGHRPELVRQAREGGVAAVVEKPLSAAILLEAVRRALEHGAPDALRVAMAIYPSIGCHA